MITDLPPPTIGTQLVPRAMLFPWPMQPRKHFHLEYLNELAASIEKLGVLNDLICRPRPGREGELEIIGGECRWRAAEMAGVNELPMKVRELSDGDALELALVDNMRRKDLTPLEECDAFHVALAQRDEAGALRYPTIEAFARSIGTNRRVVQDRLKLGKLSNISRKALDEGRLAYHVARAACECPAKIADEVIACALDPQKHNVWLPGFGYPEEPLSESQTRQLITERFVRKLDGAPFALDDEQLLAIATNEADERIEGGACIGCPWNSATTQEARVSPTRKGGRPRGEAKTCLNPGCFAKKVEIQKEHVIVEAKAAGHQVLLGAEATKVLQGSPSGTLSYAYVDLDAEVAPDDLAKDVRGKKPKWGEVVLGEAESKVVTGRDGDGNATSERLKGSVDVPVIVAIDERGRAHRIVERKVAVAAAAKTKSAVKLSLSAGRAASVQEDDAKARKRKEQEEAKLRNAVTFAVVEEAMKAVAELPARDAQLVEAFWRWMIGLASWHGGSDAAHFVTRRHELQGADQYEAVKKHAKKLEGLGQLRAFAVELLIGRPVKYSGIEEEHFRGLCKLLGVDAKGIERRVREERKKPEAGSGKKGAEKAAKKELPKVAAAPGKNEAERPPEPLREKLSEFEQLVAQARELEKDASFAFTVTGLQGKLKIGYQKALRVFDTVKLGADDNDEEMQRARALLNAGTVTTIVQLQETMEIDYESAAALFDQWIDEKKQKPMRVS